MSVQTESRAALRELIDLLEEVDQRWAGEEWNLHSADDVLNITGGGNVGIGDTTPSYKLDVAGQIRATSHMLANGNMYIGSNGGGDSALYFWDDNSDAWREIFWDDSENRFRSSHNFKINGYFHAADKMYVGDNGGGDSAIDFYDDNSNTWRTLMWDDSANHFYFEGNIQINGTKLQDPGSANNLRVQTAYGYLDLGPQNSTYCHIYTDRGSFYFNKAVSFPGTSEARGTFRPSADNSHDLGSSGRAWNTLWLHQGNQFSSGGYWTLRSRDSDRQVMELVSSERYKKDIVDMPLEEAYQVLDARVIKYRGIDDADDVPLEAGLSAESLHNAGYEYAVRYDEGHWGETPRSIYYEYLTVPLIKICQDQKDRIESLEARVTALEAA